MVSVARTITVGGGQSDNHAALLAYAGYGVELEPRGSRNLHRALGRHVDRHRSASVIRTGRPYRGRIATYRVCSGSSVVTRAGRTRAAVQLRAADCLPSTRL